MRRTPHFLLKFQQRGDLYRASEDLERTTIIDNQLIDLSKIVGNGVLSGWSVSKAKDTIPTAGDLDILVSPGIGFISNVVHRTLSDKTATVFDNITTLVYMRSTMFTGSGAFPLEIEGPSSLAGSATFVDTTPPSAPTGFSGTSPAFDEVDLEWDANSETDFDHYLIERDVSPLFTSPVSVGEPESNGILPSSPFVDSGLSGNTTYYYRISAFDSSGNYSAAAPISVLTALDSRTPPEVANLMLLGGNYAAGSTGGSIAIAFDGPASSDLLSYKITLEMLKADGTVDTAPAYSIYDGLTLGLVSSESLSDTYQFVGLPINKHYRITVQTRAVSDDGSTPPGNLSTGVSAETFISSPSVPFDVTNLLSTAAIGTITLGWNASSSTSAPSNLSVVGQKSNYRITPIVNGQDMVPIDVGLLSRPSTKDIRSYNVPAAVGFGPPVTFVDDVRYLFRITTLDGFGNSSGGVFIKGVTQDVTVPRNPRALVGTGGDTDISLSWKHSTSSDVVGYNVAYDVGSGFGPDAVIGYVEEYQVSGLTNGVITTVRIKARDDAGNLSSGITTVATPEVDTTPPAIPSFVTVSPEDSQVKVSWAANTEDDFDHYVVRRQKVANPLNTAPNRTLTVLSEVVMNLGTFTSFIDVGLDNGSVYAYSIKAIDQRSNESDYSSAALVSPANGLNSEPNRLDAPTSVVATFTTPDIILSWSFSFPGMTGPDINGDYDYPAGDGPTAFNVYRSEDSLGGFQLIASVSAAKRLYTDSALENGKTYYYIVSAVRDNAVILVDTGSIVPANSVLLARVVASGGTITTITHDKRIVESLQATISDETTSRLLRHKHSVSPVNSITTVALSSLPMRDANDIIANCFKDGVVSCTSDAVISEYYSKAVIKAKSDKATARVSVPSNLSFPDAATRNAYIENYQSSLNVVTTYSKDVEFESFDDRTIWLIDFPSIAGNLPFVGDFQVLVDGERPQTTFSIDHDRNAIVFDEPVAAGAEVSLGGLGLTYYIPALVDNRYRGYRVLANGTERHDAQVDETLQTIRFMPALASTDAVSVEIEPTVPDFGGQQGARQVSLSPDIVLSDFSQAGAGVYVSESGAFDSSDTVFVLVNGSRTDLDHYVDFATKSIVFSAPLSGTESVSLEIRNREEVQGTLPAKRVSGFDGSQIKSGTLLKAQLPALSHNGRIGEAADPIFRTLSSSNKYEFPTAQGEAGTGTTPYSIFQFDDGNFALGTSSGFLRTYFVPGLLLAAGDDVSISSAIPIGVGLNFNKDNILEAVSGALQNSGRVHGKLKLSDVLFLDSSTGQIDVEDPSVCLLQDGRVFITGGDEDGASCFIYDPVAQTSKEVASMASGRSLHTCTTMSDGRVLVTGGVSSAPTTCGCFTDAEVSALTSDPLYSDGIIGSFFLKSCEVFDPTSGPNGTWVAGADMSIKRTSHAAVLVDGTDPLSPILVAGGTYSISSETGIFEPTGEPCEVSGSNKWCDPDFSKVSISKAEQFSPTGLTWSSIDSITFAAEACGGISDGASVVVNTQAAREVYDVSGGTWSANKSAGCSQSTQDFVDDSVLDGPIKQFMRGQDGRLFCVTRNNVFVSENDGRLWIKMGGIEAAGCVHRMAQSANGTLFAATDLGVYEITSDISAQNTWFQGGLIGAGTTETFDLQPVGGVGYADTMLAGTEIGIFSTIDDGVTWTQVADLQDVRNVELAQDDLVYATVGKDLYKSELSGMAGSWTKVGTYDFIDPDAKLVVRSPLDMFIASSTGLFISYDGQDFSLFAFDRNKDARLNNVQMVQVVGSDVIVGYDNIVYLIDPSYTVTPLAEFVGIVPTVTVNGVEARTGFRYDTKRDMITFEVKRLVDDDVSVSSNYSLYALEGGEWYSHNPDAPIRVYVNRFLQDDSAFVHDARIGQIAFKSALSKPDLITIDLAQTTLKNAGEYFHSELEDKLEREKGGLALSMGRDHTGNLLQFGISVEHNFLERGVERNQYYCLSESLVDRSFNSFLSKAEFFILGRKDFDRFNSTIDYSIESDQTSTGFSALAPTSKLELSPSELLVGTEAGIFVFDPLSQFAISQVLSIGTGQNQIRDLAFAAGDAHAVSEQGIFKITSGSPDFEAVKNPGGGLPPDVYAIDSLNNLMLAGTGDGIYTASSDTDPPYGAWFRASHVPTGQQFELELDDIVTDIAVDSGVAVASIGSDVFVSFDGKVWRRAYSFPIPADPTQKVFVNRITFFANKVYLMTNQGVYSDNGSIRSDEVQFVFESIDGASSLLHMNDAFAGSGALYAVGESSYVYKLSDGAWTKEAISEVLAIQLFVVTSTESKVAISNNQIFVE